MSADLNSNTRVGATKRNLLRKMVEAGVFKFGDFQLKSGQRSPIYIDLRECFAHPELLTMISEGLGMMIAESEIDFKGIVGVPYAALPYASMAAGHFLKKPLLIVRKEAKSYGTKKLIEGKYENGDEVAIIEDVVTTGGSILEVIEQLAKEGLVAKHVYCILDREQGGKEKLNELGINLHNLLNMEMVLGWLNAANLITAQVFTEIVQALNLKYTQPMRIEYSKDFEDVKKFPFLQERADLCSSALNKRLIGMMRKKLSNLCLAVDYTTSDEILQMAERAGPFVVAIKIHADAIIDFSESFVEKLTKLSKDLEFLVLEDRKFADTANTTKLQLLGLQKIATWADLVTVHAVQGDESIAPLFRQFVENAEYRLKGVLLIAQLSCKGALTGISGYTEEAVRIAEENRDTVAGFIAQTRISAFSDLLNWTPGVNLDAATDKAGQQWRGIDEAVEIQQNDIIIVGRGVTAAQEPVQQLKRYRKLAWESLSKYEIDNGPN
ncbi:unnamed protein product [Caenorhabditis bovis]|uniref:Uridine 5'-monophosphate synthase n=1 Tax=Caenorhabditis bovis TaxID=2654633 RepID=A0A8S1EHB8_9PELO|nr:unnamed protein product [Caenorhabditis bovis]